MTRLRLLLTALSVAALLVLSTAGTTGTVLAGIAFNALD